MSKSKEFLGCIMLMIASLIWGSAFAAQQVGADAVNAFTFNGIRMLIGGVILLPFIFVKDKLTKKENVIKFNKKTFLASFFCGLALFAASSFQQIGLEEIDAGKSGFITALYIVIIPVMGLFMKRKLKINIWLSVVLACIGLYLLCINGTFTLVMGDVFTFISAIFFATQIMIIDKFAQDVDCVKLSCLQFFVVGILSLPMILFVEKPEIQSIRIALLPILYTGIASSGIAYTLQSVAQKYVKPEIASLIMSFESVFAALTGWLILNNQFTSSKIMGCIFMFAAILVSQFLVFPQKEKLKV